MNCRLCKIYLKELSFETNEEVYSLKELPKPQIKFNITVYNKKIDEEYDETSLQISIQGSGEYGKKKLNLFAIELKQAGLFLLPHPMDPQMLSYYLQVQCPALVYPYGLSVVHESISKSIFPPLILPLIDFDTIYHDKRQKEEDLLNTTL